MKEQLLQLKQDIVDISNDLKNNLADKGVTATGTLSELVNKVNDITTTSAEGLWAEIGYTGNEEPIKSGLLYAKQIKDNWTNQGYYDSLYKNDKNLYIFPDVDLSDADYLSSMFANSNLIMIPAFKFKDGASLTAMFSNCYSLITTPQIDYSNVTSLNNLFNGCSNLQNVGTIDCSNATQVIGMFKGCYNLTYNPCININKTTSINQMFANCLNLNDPDFSNFDTKNITDMGSLFNCETYFSPKINKIDISTFNTSKVENMANMFYYQKSLETLILPENFGSACKNFSYMFSNCSKLKSIGFINSISAINMSYMFDSLSEVRRIEGISAKSMTKMAYSDIFGFADCSKLRYFVCRDIGTQSAVTSVQFSYYKLTNWGVVDEDNPDAKQSVIDSLITYSYDRAAAGYSACKVTLSNNTKALLTEDEIAQITAKGYTLT